MIFQTSSTGHLKFRGEKGKYSLDKYPSGEIKINVTDDINNRDVFIIGSVLPDANSLLELMILADGLTVKGARVNMIIPYLAYARQDKPEKEEPFAARVVCNILKTARFGRAFVIDAHSIKLTRYFKFTNVIPVDIFLKEVTNIKELIIVAPDAGSVKRAGLAAAARGCEMVQIKKERLVNGRAICKKLKGDVKNRNALIIDDMIDTGTTLIEAADMLKCSGAKNIWAAATHGLFSGDAIERLEKSCIKKIYTTNTLPVKTNSRKFKNMKIEPLIETLIQECAYDRKSNNKALRSGSIERG